MTPRTNTANLKKGITKEANQANASYKVRNGIQQNTCLQNTSTMIPRTNETKIKPNWVIGHKKFIMYVDTINGFEKSMAFRKKKID